MNIRAILEVAEDRAFESHHEYVFAFAKHFCLHPDAAQYLISHEMDVRHATTPYRPEGQGADIGSISADRIDPFVRRLVLWLNHERCKTESSCDGHLLTNPAGQSNYYFPTPSPGIFVGMANDEIADRATVLIHDRLVKNGMAEILGVETNQVAIRVSPNQKMSFEEFYAKIIQIAPSDYRCEMDIDIPTLAIAFRKQLVPHVFRSKYALEPIEGEIYWPEYGGEPPLLPMLTFSQAYDFHCKCAELFSGKRPSFAIIDERFLIPAGKSLRGIFQKAKSDNALTERNWPRCLEIIIEWLKKHPDFVR